VSELREIVWMDAFNDATNWTPTCELETKPRLIRSVGYLLPVVVPGYVSLAQSLDPWTDSVGSVLHIPKVCIVEEV
jgi:hypothetical protein